MSEKESFDFEMEIFANDLSCVTVGTRWRYKFCKSFEANDWIIDLVVWV